MGSTPIHPRLWVPSRTGKEVQRWHFRFALGVRGGIMPTLPFGSLPITAFGETHGHEANTPKQGFWLAHPAVTVLLRRQPLQLIIHGLCLTELTIYLICFS